MTEVPDETIEDVFKYICPKWIGVDMIFPIMYESPDKKTRKKGKLVIEKKKILELIKNSSKRIFQ